MNQDLDALPPQKLPDVSYLGDDVSYGYDQHDMQEHARAYGRQCYELAKHEALQGKLALVQLYNEAMASLAKAVEERDSLRKAQEGREPVARLTRDQIDSIMTQHYPLDSLLRENVDAFEACVRDIEKALFSSPPPKSDESSVERSLLRKIRQQDFLCDSLRAAIDAALAAQQSKGEA